MDSVRFGRGIRALGRRRGWRQADLGAQSGMSRNAVSRIERGQADRLTIRSLDSIAAALGAQVDVRLTWNAEDLDRLLDAVHAGLVEQVAASLARCGWETVPEVSFNIYGERGSIDLLGRHPATGSLLVVEVKTTVPDIQAMLMVLDRKARLARKVAQDRGWPAAGVARLLVMAEDRTTRRRVAAFGATLQSAFPARGSDVDAWIRRPDPDRPIAGLRFLSGAHHSVARHRIGGRATSGPGRNA